MTRVAVVASSPVLRAGLESLLAAAASLVVVGSVADRHDQDDDAVPLAELVAPLAPDVVVWVADGDREALPRLTDDAPGLAMRRPAVVLLADLADPRTAVRAVRAGVRGVLPREA